MMPTLYAETPARRTRQVVADLAVVVWLVLWVRLAVEIHQRVSALGAPGLRVESAGDDLARQMSDAGRRIDRIPLVGDDVRGPFDKASDAARSIAGAGRGAQEAAQSLATILTVVVIVLAVLVVLVKWLPWRVRFVREATAARQVLRTSGDLDLFALRALANQPLTVLARLHPDAADAWRRRDPEAVRALADLELRACGLRGTDERRRTTP
ncbi:MAG: hypothetical protein Q7T56_16070 [Nocardioidaceae bacterium]|nr:hypothetical protein [Nocardioidaceae bacterium]